MDDWVLISGDGPTTILRAQSESPASFDIDIMDRLLSLQRIEGASLLSTLNFPKYSKWPRGLRIRLVGGTPETPLPVALNFAAAGTQTTFAVQQLEGLAVVSGAAGALQLSATKDIELSFGDFSLNTDESDVIIGYALTFDAVLIPEYTYIP